jgi:hypothetical protein
VDSVADKVMAIVETHHGRPSTRFRDLADLVAIAHGQRVRAADLAVAFGSERQRRDLHEVDGLRIPDERLWRTGYEAVARDVPGIDERTLDGVWDPKALAWCTAN